MTTPQTGRVLRTTRARFATSGGRARMCGALFVLALVATSACRSTTKMPHAGPVTKELRARAEEATRLGKWQQAAQNWWSIFVESQNQDEQACAETARAMMHLDDPESALNVIQQGMEQAHPSAELHELKGDALVQQDFRRAAEHCYEAATRIDPERASAWRALGRVRIDLGYEGSAVVPLKKAIELGKKDYATLALLARAQQASGDLCAAFQTYVQAFAAGDAEPAQYVQASTLFLDDVVRRSNKDAADCCRAWLDQALARDPNFTQAHFEYGVLEELLGHMDDAIAHYRRAVESDPAFLPAMRNLALIYSKRCDVENTRDMVTRALKLERDPERKKALIKLLDLLPGAASPPKSGQLP